MSYWIDRQKQLYEAMEKDEIKLKRRLSFFYNAEEKRLEKEIASFYKRYGENNIIEYRKLLERLPDSEIQLLMQNMDSFAQKYPQYAHLLPVRANMYKLDRLEGLQYTVMLQQLEIGAKNNDEITKHLQKQAHRGVNAAMNEMGFGSNFYAIDSDKVKSFVNVPWSNGSNFSSRIWANSSKLANYLNVDIAQGFARGDSYEKLTRQVCERFKHVTRKDAYRLIYTEGTYIMAESSIRPFENNYEKYRISTVGDSKVCSVCSGMTGEFNITDRKPGINFPPFHPWCRCTFEIVVDDWDKWMDDYVAKHGEQNAQKVLNNLSENDKIIAGRSPSYYELVEYNPNASFKVSLDNYSKEINDCLSNACYEVAKKGSIDGNEHLALVDLIKGEIVYAETGIDNAVGGTEFWKFLKENKNSSYAFVHNHNTASKFSETDMRTLLDDNSIEMFVISRLDGKCYIIERNSKKPINVFFDHLYKKDMEALSLKVKNGEITAGERTYFRESILVNNLIRDFTKGLKEFG